jgi:hypothetical protein
MCGQRTSGSVARRFLRESMDTIKIIYYVISYTLQFFLWLIIGRVAILLLSAGKRNFLVEFFIRFTDPIYGVVRKLFPFTRVPEDKRNSMWGIIDGTLPFFTIALLWLVEKILRVIVSVIIVNMSSQL